MERTTIETAKKIFKDDFIGIEELKPFFSKMGLSLEGVVVPDIHYSEDKLREFSKEYILILGLSEIDGNELTVNMLRDVFGTNPDVSEPCFYNQDWYLNEDFVNKTLESKWYLLKKNILEETRSKQPVELLKQNIVFPSAILCAYTFFAYYYANGKLLWCHDFVWCSDTDHNGDRIYIGKYHDIDGINKNGFSVHRHLGLRNCYGAIKML